MKKIISIIYILFICIFLSSCLNQSVIYQSEYIAIVGLEHRIDNYIGYFFLPSTNDLGTKKENGEEKSIATVLGKTISDVFSNLELSSTLTMNFKHISSFVLHESMLNESDIMKFIYYVRDSDKLDINFDVFATNESIKDIFSIKNPNNESLILTMLIEPNLSKYVFLSANPIHYLNFARNYLDNKVFGIPLINIEKIWDDELSLNGKGICFISRKCNIIPDNDSGYKFLKSNSSLEYNDNCIEASFEKYDVKYKYKDKIYIKIKAECKIIYSCDGIEKNKYLENKLKENIIEALEIENKIDILNYDYYKIKNKSYELDINIKFNN
ncbi:MAG: hypothetical protein MR357_03390 [Anaeroplasma sp.]|nr:hypothetical protein [Anaeroplasma sp.]